MQLISLLCYAITAAAATDVISVPTVFNRRLSQANSSSAPSKWKVFIFVTKHFATCIRETATFIS
ncbi:hypothetical protein FocTR4_00004242 [Fusarium oxysporum f. sp. cubense]|uniref:Secreted protein n=1 Tax=Fusarium oxysporum f. sp. cubense TaxID=61366 RepID=A0A5C6T7Y5_FUSOC|nr:hypothetical protein FocTR4_00004242 [Fusarium oxysporum f. sp. cubense]